jgi:transcription elongation GreA/GreB family factor
VLPQLDKRAVIAAFVSAARAALATASAAAQATKAGATHEEAKPENDKDTRAIEASYLAGAQGERVRELERTVGVLEALPRLEGSGVVGAGALVTLAGPDNELVCLFAPAGGGEQLDVAGRRVMIVTPRSPLGRALLGAREGDEVEVELGRKVKKYEVLAIE